MALFLNKISVLCILLQAIDGVMSLALCPQVVSGAPQHFRSSEKQTTCEGCFASQSICSVVFLHSFICQYVLRVTATSAKSFIALTLTLTDRQTLLYYKMDQLGILVNKKSLLFLSHCPEHFCHVQFGPILSAPNLCRFKKQIMSSIFYWDSSFYVIPYVEDSIREL